MKEPKEKKKSCGRRGIKGEKTKLEEREDEVENL